MLHHAQDKFVFVVQVESLDQFTRTSKRITTVISNGAQGTTLVKDSIVARSPRIHLTTSSQLQQHFISLLSHITCLSLSTFSHFYSPSLTHSQTRILSLPHLLLFSFPSSHSFLDALGHVYTGSCHSFTYKSHSLETKERQTFTNTHSQAHTHSPSASPSPSSHLHM